MTQQNSSYPAASFELYCRSALLFGSVFSFTVIMTPVVLLASFLPDLMHFKLAKIWAYTVLWLAEKICGIRYQVEGLEYVQAEKKAVVLCKHQSAWETIALFALLPPQAILLKQSLLLIPFWGWAIRCLKPIAIDRSKPKQALSQLLKQGDQRLNEGFYVVIYPEGTRTALHEHKKFSASGTLLAVRSGVPVIPVAHNAGKCWPRNSFLKYAGDIQIKIGAPITVAGRKSKEVNEQAENWIKQTVQAIGG